ncbi:MAG TPA: hypothetical protein VGM12_01750 [Trebonia sp.]
MTPLYLGWQYATPHQDPGPPPRKPAAAGPPRLSDEWLAAQRREENLIARPGKAAGAVAGTLAVLLAACAVVGWLPAVLAVPGAIVCLAAATIWGSTVRRGERGLRARVDTERVRVERLRADQENRQYRAQAEHVHAVSQWQRQRSAFAEQKRWYAVPVPGGIDRVDVAGGTLAGWSAMLTMAAAYQLAAGGEVTAVDLSGGAVAADLAGLCQAAGGVRPAVWVLPHDLARLDLAARLSPGELADVLALSASVAEEHSSARDLAVDTAILDRVISVLDDGGGRGDRGDRGDRSDRSDHSGHSVGAGGVGGVGGVGGDGGDGGGGGDRSDRGGGGGVQVRRVVAALRALAQVGDPRADLEAGLLTEREAGALSVLFGQGAAERVVLERALGMEAQLRALAALGTEPARLPGGGRLRVVAVDRRASAQSATALGSFVVTALTRLIAQGPAAPGAVSWRHTMFLLGAERLRADVLDRLTDACEAAGTGLVLAYRSMPPHVRQRIGRGNAAVAFMRLGNAEDAKAASEQIGSAHRFVLSQLTETIGTSVTDSLGGSYTSTVGDSASAATSSSDNESRSDGTGRTAPAGGGVLPLRGGTSRSAQAGTSRGTSESTSLTAGISSSTAWGVSTSRATGDSESLARSLQRSRELVVEPSELQRLPATAMIVSYGAGAERHVLLADANPAIGSLPVATLASLAGPHEPLTPGYPAAGTQAGRPRTVNRAVTSWGPDVARRPSGNG